MAKKYTDDTFTHLERDVDKVRYKTGMYISYSNELGAKSVINEIIYNSIDECRNPRSPGKNINIIFDERIDTITVEDNGRGIPPDVLEMLFTTLNSGSNIDSSAKNDLKMDSLGRNGAGTLAINALGEDVTITTYRGGMENIFKEIVFHEGDKVSERTGSCSPDKHGLKVVYKPSKILGRKTRIVWSMVRESLLALQFLNKGKTIIHSEYIDKDGKVTNETYKLQPFGNIIAAYNEPESMVTPTTVIGWEDDNVPEEIGDKKFRRFVNVEIAFGYSSNISNPYIASFANSNNTIDNGSHLDGVIEGICRYFQQVTKATLTERDKLDIKWDDVKLGLSVVVSFRSNMETLFTGQTKHKISNTDVFDLCKQRTVEAFQKFFTENPARLKECINLIKVNARARREGDRARNAVVKETLTNWSSYTMKNYDPCSNRGKAYKELFIVEGLSAKGTLRVARDPKFQALYAIRGVSANVHDMPLDKIVGPKGNAEFNNLITIMNCNVGAKFDMDKLQFNKIIISSDADIDGLFIRSLLCSFFFKLFPEIIRDGRLYIAEPPLYSTDDKKNPFIINKEDYNNRYIKEVMKHYTIGMKHKTIEWFHKDDLQQLLIDTTSYLEDIELIAEHYFVNDRLIECILEEFIPMNVTNETIPSALKQLNIDHLMKRIGEQFPEMYYDHEEHVIKGIIDGKYQSIEVGNRLLRKGLPLIDIMRKHKYFNGNVILKHNKTLVEETLSLVEVLKILQKFQPKILHRFKGLTPQTLFL